MDIAIYIVLITLVSFLFAGCTTPEPGSPEAVKQEIELQRDTVEEALETVPDWFFKVPLSENAIYTAGTGTSPNLQLSVDKGLLNAKRALADRLKSFISAKTKLFVKENGQHEQTSAVTEGEQATINLIAEADVSGYTAKKIVTLQQDTQYRTFVLLEYPIGKLNRIKLETLRKQQERESKTDAKTAFQELNRDVEKRPLE